MVPSETGRKYIGEYVDYQQVYGGVSLLVVRFAGLSWRIAGKWGKYFIWYHGNKKHSNYCVFRSFVLYLCKRTNEAVKCPFADDYRKRTDGKRKGN